MKTSLVMLLLVAFFLTSSFIHSTEANFMKVYCGPKCTTRCAKSPVKDTCLKYCGMCCGECKCVPVGPVGSKKDCQCYKDKKTPKGKPMCP